MCRWRSKSSAAAIGARSSQLDDQVIERMAKEAEDIGANAVVGVRLTTSQTMANAAEILACGMAVLLNDQSRL